MLKTTVEASSSCLRRRSATVSLSAWSSDSASLSSCISRGGVLLLPMDFIAASLPRGITGSKSRPLAWHLSISPLSPSHECTSLSSALASCPIVIIPLLLSFSCVRLPTKSRSSTGRHQTLVRKFSGVITVVASGFFISEPSFAKVLLKLTPTEAVSPSSLR